MSLLLFCAGVADGAGAGAGADGVADDDLYLEATVVMSEDIGVDTIVTVETGSSGTPSERTAVNSP